MIDIRTQRAGESSPVGRRARRNRGGWYFVLPYLVFLLAMIAYPVGFAITMSLHDWNLLDPDTEFVGLGNYLALATDQRFLLSLVNTLVFLAVNVPLTVVVGIALAIALNGRFRGRTFFRTVYFLPYVTAGVVVALVWRFILSTDDGVLNSALEALGLPGLPWLTSTWLAMPTIALVVLWKNLGFTVLLYLGGLQTIPPALDEAAEMDGANRWQRMRNITIPGLKPTTSLVVTLSTITAFQIFSEPYLMTGGGPLNSTLTPVLYLYQVGFRSFDFGYAASIGIVMAILVVAVVLLQRRLTEERSS